MEGWGNHDVSETKQMNSSWGDVDAGANSKPQSGGWGSAPSQPAQAPSSGNSGGWGSYDDAPAPAQSSGGWGESAPAQPAPAQPAQSSGGWGNDAAPASSGGWGNDAAPAQSFGGQRSDPTPASSGYGGQDSYGAPKSSGYGDDRYGGNATGGGGYDYGDDLYEKPEPPQNKYAERSGYQESQFHIGDDNELKVDEHDRNPRLEKILFGDPEKAVNLGIDFSQYEKIPCKVQGNSVPKPIDNFDGLNLHETLRLNVKLCRYTVPTPVQKYAIPIGLEGRDLMTSAQTGSGKTAAFMLPTVQRIIEMDSVDSISQSYATRIMPRALVLSPTRELAIQIYDEAKKFCYRTGLRPAIVYGGKPKMSQLADLRRGCHILIATPGRLNDFCEGRMISFAAVKVLILDEADRMLDMGFAPQLQQIVSGFDMPNRRQTLMFSATFPREIREMAADYLNDHLFLSVGRVGSTTDLIEQRIEYVDDYQKTQRLIELLKDCPGLSLVFVKTKRSADHLEDELSESDAAINSVAIHGDRSQSDREFALSQFRSGRSKVLVATDVASRGWDIPDVYQVINYDCPQNIDDYVHRIGRTGRCGTKGVAISFYNGGSEMIREDLVTLLEESNAEIPDFLRMGGGYSGSRDGGRGGGRGRGRGGNRGGGGGYGGDSYY